MIPYLLLLLAKAIFVHLFLFIIYKLSDSFSEYTSVIYATIIIVLSIALVGHFNTFFYGIHKYASIGLLISITTITVSYFFEVGILKSLFSSAIYIYIMNMLLNFLYLTLLLGGYLNFLYPANTMENGKTESSQTKEEYQKNETQILSLSRNVRDEIEVKLTTGEVDNITDLIIADNKYALHNGEHTIFNRYKNSDEKINLQYGENYFTGRPNYDALGINTKAFKSIKGLDIIIGYIKHEKGSHLTISTSSYTSIPHNDLSLKVYQKGNAFDIINNELFLSDMKKIYIEEK